MQQPEDQAGERVEAGPDSRSERVSLACLWCGAHNWQLLLDGTWQCYRCGEPLGMSNYTPAAGWDSA